MNLFAEQSVYLRCVWVQIEFSYLHRCVCLHACVYWGPGPRLTHIISSSIWVWEKKQEGFERAQRFPAAACCWEKSVSCFLLVDSVAVGHSVVVNNTKWGNVSDSCVIINRKKTVFRQPLCVSSEFKRASCDPPVYENENIKVQQAACRNETDQSVLWSDTSPSGNQEHDMDIIILRWTLTNEAEV